MAALGVGPAGPGRGEAALRRTVLLVVGAYLLLPLLAMLEFSTRGPRGTRSLSAWARIGANPDLVEAITVQLQLAAGTEDAHRDLAAIRDEQLADQPASAFSSASRPFSSTMLPCAGRTTSMGRSSRGSSA